MTLQERAYCIGGGYLATRRDDLYSIFRILNVLKQIILGFIEADLQQ